MSPRTTDVPTEVIPVLMRVVPQQAGARRPEHDPAPRFSAEPVTMRLGAARTAARPATAEPHTQRLPRHAREQPTETLLTRPIRLPRRREPLVSERIATAAPVAPGVLADPDQRPRWKPGDRMENLFEQRCDATPGAVAVDPEGAPSLTFAELDARANRLARHLRARGIGPGHRVALMFDDAVWSYTAMLAALKAGAAFVPLDAGFPADRVAYIASDANASAVLTLGHLRDKLDEVAADVVCVDDPAARLATLPPGRLTAAERGPASDDPLAYIIYTSGSTGRPKGVAIDHPSIVSFVRVAAEAYGVCPGDRMYQGMTIAFDFSVEEIWVPWAAGATLVPKPAGASLLGPDLHEFLLRRRITAMACVPTLLATIEEDLPDLRFLLVSGEACPHDLIVRWHKPGRRFLNVYGPTEATVTATWTPVDPDRAVTIGVPLPTYSVVVLDPDDPHRALPLGEVGELGIGGIGLARGYVNRDDLTEKAFIPDFVGLPANPSKRIYRTGDLCRINESGEIEYHGRIDLQVKIRGYRIELTEIESVLLQVPGVAAAVVDTYEPVPGTVELVGYYSLRHDTTALDPDAIYAVLRDRLPSYMVPAYLEHLAVIPLTTSDKADRKNLPPPTARRAAGSGREHVDPVGAAETALASALGEVLGLEQVSADAHLFDDLGANSLLLAQFCAKVRRHPDLAPVSIREVYQHPTVAALATLQPDRAPGRPVARSTVKATREPHRAGALPHALCGLVQLVLFFASVLGGALLLQRGYLWVAAATGYVDPYLRALAWSAGTFAGLALLPIVAKWLLVGRFEPGEFPVWGARYLRFWLVKTLIRVNPMTLFTGSPLHLLYLRALGAKIGKGAVVLSPFVAAAPDLLTIGPRTVVREEAWLLCYRAEAGRIRLGPVTLGADVVVAEKTVLDIDTTIGDGGRLGHCSSLQPGERVPTGQYWHGSPAQPADVAPAEVPQAKCGSMRRFWYSLLQLGNLFLLAPLGFAVAVVLSQRVPWSKDIIAAGTSRLADWMLYAEVVGISLVLFYGGVLTAVAYVLVVPRLVHKALVRPDRVHALYGIRYWAHRFVRRATNVKLFNDMLGDSSFIVGYLKALGYDLSRVFQTGSNFGTELRQDSPYLTRIGTGTMVSDGLNVLNTDVTATSFRTSAVAIGERNYLGNMLAWPVGARVGNNVLLATKAALPLDGPVRHDVGLLGSPAFEIPRTVQRDADEQLDGDELDQGLTRKNRYNRRTIALFTLVRWFRICVVLLISVAAVELHAVYGVLAIAAGMVVATVFALLYSVLVERLTAGFRRLSPRMCSIYDPYFWWHERLWKLLATPPFAGTPFRPMIMRMLGVRIGRRVLDLGTSMPEKTLITIGDDVTLNEGTIIQCHSLEDGVFKSDSTVVGAGATIGIAAFVHYGVTVGAGAVIGGDAFLMKGEEAEDGARWVGNPAREVAEAPDLPVLPVRRSVMAPVALAGLVAVALPAGVTTGMTGATLPSAWTAAAATAPLAVPADDAEADVATDDASDDPAADDADTSAVAAPTTVVRPISGAGAAARPATRRAAAVATTAPKARSTASTTRTTTKATTTTKSSSTKTTSTKTSSTKTSSTKTSSSKTTTTKTRSGDN
jgi:non-ribosomal peptide synthetase-like protein